MTLARPHLKPGVPFDLSQRHYLKHIYANDSFHEMVIMKAGQMGLSERAVSGLLYDADVHRANGLYLFPNDKLVSDFSAARFGPAVESKVSPYLASILVSGAGDERGADKVSLKRVRDAFIYFRGATLKGNEKGEGVRAPQLESIDADSLIVDEFDVMDRRALPIARERLGGSAIKREIILSCPSYAGFGVHREYVKTNQRIWHIKCGHCGEWCAIDGLELLVKEYDALNRPMGWNGMGEGEAGEIGEPYLACLKCGGKLDRLAEGEWVPKFPAVAREGYLVLGLVSPRKTLAEIITALQEIDESDRQQAYNKKVGLPYKSSFALSLTESILNGCRREYLHGRITSGAWCGVDVGSVMHVVIRDKTTREQLYAGTVATFEEVSNLMRIYAVSVCVIDALPETHKVREFQAAHPRGKVWLAYFNRGEVGSGRESFATWNGKESKVDIDRTRSLDDMLAKFIAASNNVQGVPHNTIPANARDIRDYYRQMCAPERQLIKDARGNQVPVYIESEADHFCLAECYTNVAALCPLAQGWARGPGG